MHFFRKHKQALLIFICVAIGIPMLFFGVPQLGAHRNPYDDIEVAQVGGVPVMASELRRNLSTAAKRQARDGEPPSFKELGQSGVAGEVLQQMMTSALISGMEAKRNFNLEQGFLEERLKKDPGFQTEDGQFNGAYFNDWVQANRNADWDAIYSSIQEQVSRQAFMNAQLAAANRVLDADVERELRDNTTKIQMEYIKVEPPVELTEDEIQAHYDEKKESYRKPPTITADYVAISLKPEGPSEKVNDVLAKAKAADSDFAALADEFSDLETKNGGDLGWLAERETELDYRKPLFALAIGDVSDPVKGPNGYYIYKVEEERTNEETGKREVKARHIYIKVELSDEEREARKAQAETLAAKLREMHGLQTAEEEAKADPEPDAEEKFPLPEGRHLREAVAALADGTLTVATASDFNVESVEIAGIPKVDAFQFRRVVDEEAKRGKKPEFNIITGRDNLYVAEITAIEEGEIPPLSDVRDAVMDDAKAAKKGEDAYKDIVAEYADKIVAQAKTLDEAKAAFPELNIQIKETRPFTKKEYLFQDQIYLQTQEIYAALEDKEANAIAGPLTDFLGGTYFVALTNRTEPTDEEKANWDEEGKAIRDRMLAMARYEITQDFTEDLRQRHLEPDSPEPVSVSLDEMVYQTILGLGEENAEEGTAEDAPASETGEDTPAVDGGAGNTGGSGTAAEGEAGATDAGTDAS